MSESNSISQTFKDLGLVDGKLTDNEQNQSNSNGRKKIVLSQRSLTLEEEKVSPDQEKKTSQLEEQKVEQSQAMITSNLNLLKRKLDKNTKEELKQIKLSLDKPKQETPVLMSFRPQKKYPRETKIKAVELCQKVGVNRVASSTGIPESSLRRWSKVGVDRLGTSGRAPFYQEIEEDLFNYFKNLRTAGISINNQLLLNEARRIANSHGIEGFLGTLSWLDGFKKRHDIVYRRPTRTSQKLSPDSVEMLGKFQKEFLVLVESHGYPLEAICNIDETGICFDMPLHHTLDNKVFFFLIILNS